MSPAPHGDEGNHDKGPQSDEENEVDAIQSPEFVINADIDSSEEEDDEEGFNGYQMLPQDPLEENGISDSDDDTDEENATGGPDIEALTGHPSLHHIPGAPLPSYMQVPDLPKQESKDLLWNKQRSQGKASLEPEQADKIKEAMASIVLPPGSIPAWAANISEEDWKSKLSNLQSKETS